MSIRAESQVAKGRERHVGKVHTRLTVTNRADEIRATSGLIREVEVRTITLDDVLVDTGATTLCLPQDLVEALGLQLLEQVSVATATGITTARVYEDAKLSLYGRTGTFDCIALPEGTQPLLGVIPLERLGLEPGLQNQRLRVLPDHGRQTYILAPSPIIY